MLLGDFLNTFAGKAGIPNDNAELKAILSNATISSYEIPDSITSKIEANLMTVEAAKSNPVVRAALTAQVYNGMDKELLNAIEARGFDDATKAELLAETSTTKRAALAIRKAAEIEAAKAIPLKGKESELQKEIERLNGLNQATRTEYENKLATKEVEKQSFIVDHELSTLLSGYEYALPKEMPQTVKIQTAKLLLNEELKTRGAKVIYTNEGARLVNSATEAEYFDDKNNKVDLKGFVDYTVAKNKLLATAPAANPKPTPTTVVTGSAESGSSPTTSAWDKAISAASMPTIAVV